jgi:hypothetical protein
VQDVDLGAFMSIFRGLIKMFPKRGDEDEITDLAHAYFAAFRRFSIAQLQAGADVWKLRGKFFPKPAEWIECIPRSAGASVALSPLSAVDAAEHLDAERRSYEADPCGCRRCVGAGVSHRFLRFVPEEDEQGRDARGLIGERVVTRGHWAHGDELARFYVARERFWSDFGTLIGKRTIAEVA